MTQITLNDDLARMIAGASSPIVLVDGSGRRLGMVTKDSGVSELPPGMTAERWAEILHRLDNPGKVSTLQEIKQRLGQQDRQ